MNPKDKFAESLAALDRARRVLEQMASVDTGDSEIDETVSSAGDEIEAQIAALSLLHRECV